MLQESIHNRVVQLDDRGHDLFDLLDFDMGPGSESPAAASLNSDMAEEFNLDLDEPATQQPIINLANLWQSQQPIDLIKNATFDDEKAQWTAEEFENFRNPPQFQTDLEDRHERLSFRVYLSLSKGLPALRSSTYLPKRSRAGIDLPFFTSYIHTCFDVVRSH